MFLREQVAMVTCLTLVMIWNVYRPRCKHMAANIYQIEVIWLREEYSAEINYFFTKFDTVAISEDPETEYHRLKPK